jgi:hypothetical protein
MLEEIGKRAKVGSPAHRQGFPLILAPARRRITA